MKTAIVMGTRPEIIKLAPVINKLHKKDYSVIFTEQHFDYHMGLKFIEQLGIRKPDYSLKIERTVPVIQISQIINKLAKIFTEIKPDTVIVQGDTNTVLAASVCSLKSGIPISHVESGLRSFDWRMPEEHNRIATDHLSELLFAPTKNAKNNLINEKVHGKIFITGNTIIDSINNYEKFSSKQSQISIDKSNFILMTLHRAENVDDKKTLIPIIRTILNSNEDFIFPAHPRTIKKLQEFKLYEQLTESDNVLLLESVGYFEMLELMKKCLFIITDSGGIQEEATSEKIRKKVLVLRKTTDRPEAVFQGFSKLIGTNPQKIDLAIKSTSKNPNVPHKPSPFGNGHASEKIVSLIKKNIS